VGYSYSYSCPLGNLETLKLNPVQFLADLGQKTLDAVNTARTWYNMTAAQYQSDAMLNRLESIAHLFGAEDAEALACCNAPAVTGPNGIVFVMPWDDFATYRTRADAKVAEDKKRADEQRTAAKVARHAFVAHLLTHIGDDEMRERHKRGLLPQRDLLGALLPAAFEPRLVYSFSADTGRPTTLSAEEFILFTDVEQKLRNRNVCGLVYITEVTPVIIAAEIYARITMRDATGDADWHHTVFVYLSCRCDD
jgi:hypothetical protein